MTRSGLCIGLIDSGLASDLTTKARASRAFLLDQSGQVLTASAEPDRVGHGSLVASIVLGHEPNARLINAQVFHARLMTSAAAVAAALDWAIGEGARLITLSLGLREDRAVLRDACARALEQDAVLLASSPAQGAAVFPASYPGVIRITGDARCAPDEISHLASAQADFGACVRAGGRGGDAGPPATVAGASLAVAHVCGHLAKHFAAVGGAIDPTTARAFLNATARYHGPERRAARS
jgi:hypothetical protein